MGRRSSKGRHATRINAAFDTVGLNILPGVDLPEWAAALAEPGPQAQVPIADQPMAPESVPAEQTWAAQPTMAQQYGAQQYGAQQPDGAVHATPGMPPQRPASATESAQAMAGVGALVGATAGLASAPSAMPGVAGDTTLSGFAPVTTDPSWPGDPTPSAPIAAAHTLTPAPPRPGQAEQPPNQPWESTEQTPDASAAAEHHEFSDEQVALLSWWADTIAAGNQPPVPSPERVPERATARNPRRVPRWALIAALLALAALVALAGALIIGPRVGGDPAAPQAAPATDLTMPATVEDLVTITDDAVTDEMRPLIGFALRPAGITVTAAYGPDQAGPLSLAAMATTMGAPGNAASQIQAWAQRTGAVVEEPVVGSGARSDVTCASASATENVPAGSFCVWSAEGQRGQTYAIDMPAKQALELTAAVRAGTSV